MANLKNILKLIKAARIVAKYNILPENMIKDMPPLAQMGFKSLSLFSSNDSKSVDERTAIALSELGPTYIKLGQFLATRADLVGVELSENLKRLQDDVPAFERSKAVASVETQMGKKLDELFDDFSEPVAAASIAQVHSAKLKSGEKVAVKLLRPNVEKQFKEDLAGFAWVAKMAEKVDANARRLRLIEVVATLKKSIDLELNLNIEAASISEMQEHLEKAERHDFSMPNVHWDLTSHKMLTSSWIDGTPLSDEKAVAELGLDRAKLAKDVVVAFLTQALEFGFFHADMHQGNIFVGKDGSIKLVDFGIMSRLNKDERRFLAEILYGFVSRDYMHNARVHFEAGYVPKHHNVEDFAQALRVIGERMVGKPADQVSMGAMLGQLLQTTEDFDMKTQLQLVLLQKNLVIVEGVARMIDPKFDMFKAIEPVLEAWLKKTIGVEGKIKDYTETLVELSGHIPKLPAYIDEVKSSIEQLDKIAKSDEVMAEVAKSNRRHARMQTGLLAAVAAAFIIGVFF